MNEVLVMGIRVIELKWGTLIESNSHIIRRRHKTIGSARTEIHTIDTTRMAREFTQI